MSDRQHPPAGREFIGRTIQLLVLGDMLVGVVLAVLGFVFDMAALAVGGAVLAAMGLGLAVLVRILARRDPGQTPARRQSPHQRRR